ncbi:5-methyltetrahydropteroyltriglutamate--homocysteine methyltransferase [Streptomyces sp. NPDC042898]|uniref:5-methyltetrahydropteroyltriglutamate-- homocysteine methyltransferase n=1 Tax=Streptomyces sp. NPDC042898 TaxID=3154334 RepID=UPI003400009F
MIPAELIGSIPRTPELLAELSDFENGRLDGAAFAEAQGRATRETIERLEATGSPVVTDGEQAKPSFLTYPVEGLSDLADDGVVIPFADGHTRQLPRLTSGPFRGLNNKVLSRFTAAERARIGAYSGPGADQDSAHSLDVDYAELLPRLFKLTVGDFYLQLASEPDRAHVLAAIAEQLRPGIRVFVGVTDPLDPRVETVQEVRDRVLEAARHIPLEQLGTCDDAGFAPFADDTSTSRDVAFAKIRARVEGTALAVQELGA